MSETVTRTLPTVRLACENGDVRKVPWTGQKAHPVLMAMSASCLGADFTPFATPVRAC